MRGGIPVCQRDAECLVDLLLGSAAAGGIALINTCGAVGGFVGPYAVGLVREASGSFAGGLLFLAALLAGGAVLAMQLRGAAVFGAESSSAQPIGQHDVGSS